MPGEPRHRGLLLFCEFYLQELYLVLTVSITEKSFCASGQRWGKGAHLKYSRHSVILKTITETVKLEFLGETVKPEPNMVRFYQSLTDLEKGK